MKHLDEQLRIIYLTEDIWGIGQKISQKIKSLSGNNLTPDKLKEAVIEVPPLDTIYELSKNKIENFENSIKELSHVKAKPNVKKALVITHAALRDLEDKDPTLKDHIKEILAYFADYVKNLAMGASETVVFLFLLYLLIRLFKKPTFTVRVIYWLGKKFLVVSIILVLMYGLAKGAEWVERKTDESYEEKGEVE